MSTKINNSTIKTSVLLLVVLFAVAGTFADESFAEKNEEGKVFEITFQLTPKMVSICDTCAPEQMIDGITVESIMEKAGIESVPIVPLFPAEATTYIEVRDNTNKALARYSFPWLMKDDQKFIPAYRITEVFIPLTGKEASLHIIYENKEIGSKQITQWICTPNSRCEPEHGENAVSCSQDCAANSADRFCQGETNGVCDPDCGYNDYDCTEEKLCLNNKKDVLEEGIDCGTVCKRKCQESTDLIKMLHAFDQQEYSQFDVKIFLSQFNFRAQAQTLSKK